MKTFTNPYEGVDKDGKFVLLQTHIDPNDYMFVRLIRPKSGTIRTVVNLLWKKLINSLKDHGITDFSRCAEFESFVANAVLIDGRPDPAAVQPGVERSSAGKSARRHKKVDGGND